MPRCENVFRHPAPCTNEATVRATYGIEFSRRGDYAIAPAAGPTFEGRACEVCALDLLKLGLSQFAPVYVEPLTKDGRR